MPRAALLLVWLLTGIFGSAAAQQPVKELSLPEALQMALQANQTARKARLDIENTTYQINEVKARALPQISGNANLTYNPILQQSAMPGDLIGQPGKTLLVTFGQKWISTFGVSLSQNLFDHSIITGLRAARGSQEYFELNGELAEEQVIELVTTAYYNVLVQRQKIEVIDSTIATTKKSEAIITGQYQNGLGRQIDVDRIAVNLANLRNQRLQLQNAVDLMENQLKYVIGMDVRQKISLPDMDLSQLEVETLEFTTGVDVHNRTEYKALKKQEELLHFQKESFRSAYFPALSLSGNYNYQGLGNKLPYFKGSDNGVNWFDYSSIGASLRIPIFQGGANRSRIKQADVSIRKLQEDIAQTELALNMAFENAKIQLNNSIIALNDQKKNVDLARKVLTNNQNNYNQGLASLTDLLQSENAVTQAENNFSTSLLDYKLAEIQLLKAQGKLKSLLN